FVEEADVFDAPLQERRALDAHAEGKPSVAIGIVAHGFEYRRMDHAAAEDLDPAGALAHRAVASRPAARSAADVHFSARFRVREEAGPEAQLPLLAEQLAQ